MSEQSRAVLSQALRLSLEERAEVAAELLASIDNLSDPDAESAWAVEIERRAREALSGKSTGQPMAGGPGRHRAPALRQVSKPVHVGKEAKEELAAEVERYDGMRAGLGQELLEAVKRTLRLLEEVPGIGTAVAGVPRDLGVRKVLLPRFPYAIVILELPQELRVIAFAHGRRKPGYWRRRLR